MGIIDIIYEGRKLISSGQFQYNFNVTPFDMSTVGAYFTRDRGKIFSLSGFNAQKRFMMIKSFHVCSNFFRPGHI